jgi:hypothetical protein
VRMLMWAVPSSELVLLMWPNDNGQTRLTGSRAAILEGAMRGVYRLKILWGKYPSVQY